MYKIVQFYHSATNSYNPYIRCIHLSRYPFYDVPERTIYSTHRQMFVHIEGIAFDVGPHAFMGVRCSVVMLVAASRESTNEQHWKPPVYSRIYSIKTYRLHQNLTQKHISIMQTSYCHNRAAYMYSIPSSNNVLERCGNRASQTFHAYNRQHQHAATSVVCPYLVAGINNSSVTPSCFQRPTALVGWRPSSCAINAHHER